MQCNRPIAAGKPKERGSTMQTIDNIETPAVLIDTVIAERNLARAQDHITARGMTNRPHIKTHKLPRFAHRQAELGAVGITCQKLSEAEVMADHGVSDILISYNILGASKLARLRSLSERINLAVCVDSAVVADGLAAAMAGAGRPLSVLIECETGAARCGVTSPQAALELAHNISSAGGLHFKGLMTYPPKGDPAKSNARLAEIRDHILAAGLTVETISSGGTPDLWSTSPSIATEYRPGTYIYNDIMQIAFGSATLKDCALTVLTTVVSRPTPDRAIIDAGSKAMSSDTSPTPGFGHIVGYPDAVLTHMNEEHGMLDLSACDPDQRPQIGERLRIIPNHACVVSNLYDLVHLIDDAQGIETVPVAARGCLT